MEIRGDPLRNFASFKSHQSRFSQLQKRYHNCKSTCLFPKAISLVVVMMAVELWKALQLL
jgi:hypothetical protein